MAQTSCLGPYLHRRTVRFKPPPSLEVDSKILLGALKVPKEELVGLVPRYGGKCYDITTKSAESASILVVEGLNLDGSHDTLTLLGVRSIHVSVFVSVEFPDELLLDTLSVYGELKSRAVRRVYFKDEGLQHLENGARVVEFTRLKRDIPKQIVAHGVPIGLKYTGQPNTCFKCGSPEHIVKNCPKRSTPRGNQPSQIPRRRDWGDTTLPGPPIPTDTTNMETDHPDPDNENPALNVAPPAPEANNQLQTQELFTPAADDPAQANPSPSGGKRTRPDQSDSDEDDSSKRRILETSTADDSTAATASEGDLPPSPEPTSSAPTPPPDISYKYFMAAMAKTGWERSALMVKIPPVSFYRCRGLFLQHQHGDFTSKVGKKSYASDNEIEHWRSLKGKIKQDAFADLLAAYQDLKARHDLFK